MAGTPRLGSPGSRALLLLWGTGGTRVSGVFTAPGVAAFISAAAGRGEPGAAGAAVAGGTSNVGPAAAATQLPVTVGAAPPPWPPSSRQLRAPLWLEAYDLCATSVAATS